MGYDMVWAEVWERDDYWEGVNWSDDPEWYFRLNIGGMGRTMPPMRQAGMVHDVGYDGMPPWPDCRCGEAECDHIAPVLRYAPEVPGIGSWKFSSNDSWLIGPVEIQGALHMLERNGRPDDTPDWWDDWVAWLAESVEHGGVRQG